MTEGGVDRDAVCARGIRRVSAPEHRRIPVEAAAVANHGRDREHSADAYLLLPEAHLLAVVTGIGTDPRGERAARRVVEAARAAAREEGPSPLQANLLSALDWTDLALRQDAHAKATFTGLVFANDLVHVAHVGRARAYRMRRGELTRLTLDHTFGAQCVRDRVMTPSQAAHSPVRGLLTRALGAADAQVDTVTFDVAQGDTFLLATTGLHAFVTDDTLAAILGTERDPERVAVRLAQAAIDGGSNLDVTALVAMVG
jgi:serine/threonine protein phosphatase PrpC